MVQELLTKYTNLWVLCGFPPISQSLSPLDFFPSGLEVKQDIFNPFLTKFT